MLVKVGIIGNARNISPANENIFALMCKKAFSVIKDEFHLSISDVILVSGGAAWVDHIAVSLFIDGVTSGVDIPYGLELYLPCSWSDNDKKYEDHDSGNKNWRVNPGYLANTLHYSFSNAVKPRNSLHDLHMARHLGAVFVSAHRGFHNRNTAVAAACDYIIAFTMDASKPEKGGTADTWNKFKGFEVKKRHVNIPSLLHSNTSQCHHSLISNDSRYDDHDDDDYISRIESSKKRTLEDFLKT